MKNLCGHHNHHYDCECNISGVPILESDVYDIEEVKRKQEAKYEKFISKKKRKIVTNFTPKKKKRK